MMNEMFDILVGFSKIICTAISVQDDDDDGDDDDDDEEEKGNAERKENRKKQKLVGENQGSGLVIISTSFHSFYSLWICVAILLHIVSKTTVEAVCTPSNKDDLILARDACLKESGDRRLWGGSSSSGSGGSSSSTVGTGNCPNFAAASNGAGCNNGGVNGVIGDWDVSQATTLNRVFYGKGSFNADISKWDVSSVTNMESSTSLCLTLTCKSFINQIVLLLFFSCILFILLFLLYSVWPCLCVQRRSLKMGY